MMQTGEDIANAIRSLRDQTYRLTAEQGVEVHLPDAAFDQLVLYGRDSNGLMPSGIDDPHLTFEGVVVWRKGPYSLKR